MKQLSCGSIVSLFFY